VTEVSITRENLVLPETIEIIDGEVRVPELELELVLEDNFTGKQLGRAKASSDASVEAALAAADRVHTEGSWFGLGVERRAEILDKIGVALAADAPRLAALESYATGAPVKQTSVVGFITSAAFHLAAQTIRNGALSSTETSDAGHTIEVHHFPLGPALNLVPWNAPAPMAAHKTASSLAAGAPTILKPSEYAPYATTDQGGTSVGDLRVRAVSFTGGLVGGSAIAAQCAKNYTSLQLELGGNNPLVILPDTDTKDAARAAVDLMTTMNGQWCRALGRLVLPADRADEILAATLAELEGIKAGDPLDPTTDFGPIVHSSHRARLDAAIAERVAAGGTPHSSTPVPDAERFLAPTLLTGVSHEASREEVFGPVATVHTYSTDAEAVAIANGTPFGLEAYVFGQDTDRALAVARQIRAGEVKVNGSTIMSLHLMTPRPAWGLSGMGEEGTVETIRTFTGAQVVGVEGAFALHRS
jgi:acyl-CoA reductase-like NAD-dependent aldehyde dehydrogenase